MGRFCIHSARLCLLVGVFSPITFKVINDVYMFLWPFSLLFGVDFVDLFSSLLFLAYISLFNICCKAGLVVLKSLLLLVGKAFLPPPINFE